MTGNSLLRFIFAIVGTQFIIIFYNSFQTIFHPKPFSLLLENDIHWRRELSELYRIRPNVTIGIPDKTMLKPNWFGFFGNPESFSNCRYKCRMTTDIREKVDAYLYHTTSCNIPNKENEPLVLHAAIRNENDAYPAFSKCASTEQEHGKSEIDITMSYHRYSTLWANYAYKPYSLSSLIDQETKKLNFTEHKSKFQGACAFISNCVIERMQYIDILEKYIPIRHYGKCKNNAKTNRSKVEELNNCMFYLAFENLNQNDYVTEKFFEGFALTSRTLMVYRGAPNIRTIFPRLTYIDANEFENADQLGKYLKRLLNDTNEFNKYWDFDATKIQTLFNEIHERNVINLPCKLCTAVAEMKYARSVLAQLDIVPPESKRHISKIMMQEKLETPPLNILSSFEKKELMQLWDLAYGRLWRNGNHKTQWNDLSYNLKQES